MELFPLGYRSPTQAANGEEELVSVYHPITLSPLSPCKSPNPEDSHKWAGVSLRHSKFQRRDMAPPFMNAHGLVPKIFDKIIEASQPERFTQDFLKTKLGFDSGSSRPVIPLLKKLGFIGSDGAPTALYAKFRNPDLDERGKAMATGLRTAYKEVYDRSEFAHDLTKEKFKNMIVEMTGLGAGDATVNAIVGTFTNLKAYAKFDAEPAKPPSDVVPLTPKVDSPPPPAGTIQQHGLNLSYTINLNLPETTDVEVFNAIFRSLKENLLKAG